MTCFNLVNQLIILLILLKSFREQYQSILTFYIPNTTNLLWSNMFGLMENAKHLINIEDYSLSQTSLEQVFLSFTKYQKDNSPN